MNFAPIYDVVTEGHEQPALLEALARRRANARTCEQNNLARLNKIRVMRVVSAVDSAFYAAPVETATRRMLLETQAYIFDIGYAVHIWIGLSAPLIWSNVPLIIAEIHLRAGPARDVHVPVSIGL